MSDALDKLRQAQNQIAERLRGKSQLVGDCWLSKSDELVGRVKSAMITDEDRKTHEAWTAAVFDETSFLPPSFIAEHDTTISRQERAKARLIKRLQAAGLTTTKE